MEHQALFSPALFFLRHPLDQLVTKLIYPPFKPPSKIKPDQIPNVDGESNGVDSPGVVPLHVPPQVFRSRSQPPEENHRRLFPALPERIRVSLSVHGPWSSVPDGDAVAGLGSERVGVSGGVLEVEIRREGEEGFEEVGIRGERRAAAYASGGGG